MLCKMNLKSNEFCASEVLFLIYKPPIGDYLLIFFPFRPLGIPTRYIMYSHCIFVLNID